MDALTLSLNTVRPVAIRALIRLVHRFPGSFASADALAVIETHLGDRDRSIAVAAAIGEGMARLYDSARPWLESHSLVIFGSTPPTTPAQQVAL